MGSADLPPTLTGSDAAKATQFSLQRPPTLEKSVTLVEAREILSGRFDIIGPEEIKAFGKKIGRSDLPEVKFFDKDMKPPEEVEGFDRAALEAVSSVWQRYFDSKGDNVGQKGTMIWIPDKYQRGDGEIRDLTTGAMMTEVVPPSDGLVHRSVQEDVNTLPADEVIKPGGRWAIFFPKRYYRNHFILLIKKGFKVF